MLRNAVSPELFELMDTGSPGDIDFYCKYARHRGGPVLSLMCGTGRIALPIARLGIPVIGIDSDGGLIDQAKRKGQQLAPGRVMFFRADPANFETESKHPLVIIPSGGLQRILTLDEQRQALLAIRSAMGLGGKVLLDLPVWSPAVPVADLPALRMPSGSQGESGAMLARIRTFDSARQVVSETIACEWLAAGGIVDRKEYCQVLLRYSTPAEIQLLLESCGFEPTLYGGFDLSPLMPGATRLVVEAERQS